MGENICLFIQQIITEHLYVTCNLLDCADRQGSSFQAYNILVWGIIEKKKHQKRGMSALQRNQTGHFTLGDGEIKAGL